MNRTITDVKGIKVGHYTDDVGLTGCTVVLAEAGALAGVDVRGAAPGTRETDLLRPGNLVQKVHAVLLTGGSAFGLDAASGVMSYLLERGIGFDTGVVKVPIVTAAVIYDLQLGDPKCWPGKDAGYQAARSASAGKVEEGNVGAGTGASVGKLFGIQWACKSGVGSWSISLDDGTVVGALAVVNAFGDVVVPATGKVIAGARNPLTGKWVKTAQALVNGVGKGVDLASLNTTLAVVATNAMLTKEMANRIAVLCHDALARVIWPCHTMFDGDTVFVLSTGDQPADLLRIGVAATMALEESILRAVRQAKSIKTPWGILPAACEERGETGE